MLFRDEDLAEPARRPPHNDDLDSESEALSGRGTLYRLLDPAFGFGVWAVHFLVVYSSAAVFCALGGEEPGGSAVDLRIALALATLVSGGGVIWHAVTTYRLGEGVLDRGFLRWITIGNDAIASVAILWMLLPILLVPACS